MSSLINIGLVTSHKEGRFVKYHIEGDISDITSFLKSYYPTIWSKLSNRLAELFLDLTTVSWESARDKNKTTISEREDEEEEGQKGDKTIEQDDES